MKQTKKKGAFFSARTIFPTSRIKAAVSTTPIGVVLTKGIPNSFQDRWRS
jgi:hypothetical protein